MTTVFGHYRVPHFFIDVGATSDIIYRQCFDLLEENDKRRLTPVNALITCFNQSIEYPLGQLTFPVTLSDGVQSRTEDVDFLIMETPHLQYDILLGRQAIGDFNANPLMTHGIFGVPTPTGIAMIHANKECHMAKAKVPPQKMLKTNKSKEVEKLVLNEKFPEQNVTIGTTLSDHTLKRLLVSNIDVFAWTPTDMTGVPRSKAEDKLKVNPTFVPIVQKRRKMGPEQAKACDEQVKQLMDAGIIRKIQYQTWVKNLVMVPKANGQWRMCIDFKDLNKACHKNCYPLPEIDLKLDVLVPYRYKYFLDAYKGYHQIHMAAGDQDKTTFRTKKWNVLLQDDAIWPKKCRVHIPSPDGQRVQESDWKKLRSLYG
ncbi:uncharacterized protein LOC143606226 [Bidens hawaiensis]|uniref:uncharacterized protein LOC143606226 n=1 Tax=Bidens hawaiensis TaxID=980011 RepID=UPI00404A2946